ncbi:MAG: hypothetical protein K8T25_07890 [Planctomycetia bacterium]|nr:hypothetical protein [Planctomycetia bacterium]
MATKHRLRTYSILELAATLEEMPANISVWIEGLGEAYKWGSLKQFRDEAAELLAYDRPAYPAVVKIDSRIHPVCGVDVYGDRVALIVLPELVTPDMSRQRAAASPG